MRAPLRPRDLMAIALVGVFALVASGTHVVRSGETLSDIASRNGTSVRALVEANGIKDPDLIVAGTTLRIPGGAAASTGTPVTTYVVRTGDTLGSIARRFGTTVSAIARANNISDPNRIYVGTSLTIGSSGGASGGTALPTPTGGRQLAGQRHAVQPGETISSISRRYGIAQADFVRWNGLVDGKLYAGAKLLLFDPGSLPGTSTQAGPTSHVVAAGETLSGIASRFGTTPSAIASASGLSDPNAIRVGQKLTIPAAGASGSVRCPVPGASFINDWGFPRSGGRAHAGNDLFAARGTPVHAPVSGWVDHATGTIGGHQFRLKAADGTLWFGSHMDRFGARGQVAAGDVIGYVGDSGNARGSRPHLHFEIHPASMAVNPFPLLREVC